MTMSLSAVNRESGCAKQRRGSGLLEQPSTLWRKNTRWKPDTELVPTAQ